MEIFLLWATWAHEYMAILSQLMGIARRGVLKELEVCDFDTILSVNEMMAVPVKKNFLNFLWSRFLIIR